ncbi:peroxiredoxin [Flavobacterium beibuense F44-8]|uniref:Peroxiredoxin n=1 Tax=Flavobacterium beibuense F44-8 TaxID=1406840 RepID=A0A0A2LNJ2_9FLAO|nr:OsmC family protein [Flavobacterium beibuense]KGO80753.1 peroxiredoxin [Flavobacterium beibuense F44-8]
MKFTRKATANWKGTGMEGTGKVSTQSTVLNDTQLSFKTRFADGVGTNPEELLAAAHSGCFTMQLSFLLNEAGFTADNLDTEAKVTFEDGTITTIVLDLTGSVPGITTQQFSEIADKAKQICPISKAINADISLNVTLV